MDNKYKKILFEGLSHINNKNYSLAETTFKKIYFNYSSKIEILTYLIPILIHQNKYDEAKSFSNILMKSEYKELSFVYYGIIFYKLRDFSNSLINLNKALEINPKNYDALLNKGIVLNKISSNLDGIECIKLAIKINPKNPIGYHNLATLYEDENMIDDAIKNFNQSILLNPKDYNSLHSLSLLQLTQQKFDIGFMNYEYRIFSAQGENKHNHIKKLVSVKQLNMKKILIWHEQGLGDTIQFSRYINVLEEYGAIVTFQVQKDLVSLFKNYFNIRIEYKIDTKEKFDFQLALLSLPHFLINNQIKFYFSYNKPLKSINQKYLFWKNELPLSINKKNVGIAISGNKKNLKEERRKIDLNELLYLSNYVNLFVIQKDLTAQDNLLIKQNSNVFFLGNNTNWKDMSDTAAIIDNMDFVISIDTSLIHLAGFMNKKSYLLLSKPADWRWGESNKKMQVWYPSIKILRQEKKGIWKDVILKLNSELGINLN